MTVALSAPYLVAQAVSGGLCLAVGLHHLSREGGLASIRRALTVLSFSTACAFFALLAAAFEPQAEGAIAWHAVIRINIAFVGVSALATALLLLRPRASRVGVAIVVGGAALAVVGVLLTFQTSADQYVRTSASWFPTANTIRVFDTFVVGTGSLAVTGAALWRLVRGDRYARRAMMVLVAKQLIFTLTFVAIRAFGSAELVQSFLVLAVGPSTLILWAVLRDWRVAGVDHGAYKLAFQATPLPVIVVDLHTDVVALNPPALALFGPDSTAHSVVQRLGLSGRPQELLATHAGAKLEDIHLQGAPGSTYELRIHFDARNGIGLVLLVDVTERVEHARSLAHSLAELQRMQQRLVINEKMASLGVLVAGVNHEINNPLAYTMANLRSATESVRSLLEALPLIRSAEGPGAPALQQWAASEDVKHAEADVLDALRDASEGASRISELVSSMRLLTRPAGAEVELDLAECARAGLKIGRTGLKPGVEIFADLALRLSVRGDASELTRVVTNLVVNAGQSMGDAGRLTLRAFEDGGCAVLEVEDSGPGVPDDLRARIFDPFFTTRSPGQGTGLGLAISLETARRHNGELQLADALPGATFRLRIPLATNPAV